MKILFEDKFLVVALKDAGISSQPDPSGREDMISILKKECNSSIFCVHRLDTATSGVMVYAKDSKTAGRLTASLADSRTKKQYVCVVRGESIGNGTMTDLLFHDKRKNKAYVVDRKRAGVKEAVLHYSSISEKDGKSLVKVTLETGRTHQIRVQFASRKMPLLGDGKYGSKDNLPLALHCFSLTFPHPVTGKIITYDSVPDSPWYGFDTELLK